LLFLAGVERSASPLAQIGFHQPNFPGLSPQDRQDIIQSNSQDYREAGMAEGFIARIMATPPDKMWYPSNEEMTAAGVLNTVLVSRRPGEREVNRLNQVLEQAVTNINSRRGNMVDKVTRLEGAQVKDGLIMVDFLVTQQLAASPSQFAVAMTPMLRKQVCGGPDQAMINAGGKYRFDYRYRNGREAGTVLIEHCY
jgi:hypothetical protein